MKIGYSTRIEDAASTPWSHLSVLDFDGVEPTIITGYSMALDTLSTAERVWV